MTLSVAIAFLAGLVTVLSPCVLPLLPVILSPGLNGGRVTPIAVAAGFIGSFALVTLGLAWLVDTFGVPTDIARWISVVVLLLVGLTLAIPPLDLRFEAIVSRHVPQFAGGSGRPQGIASGLVTGAGLGLAWTPCVGPVMAAVLTLAMNHEVNTAAVITTLAFASGSAIPMAAVIIGGSRLLARAPWLRRNTVVLRRVFGILIVVAALAIATGMDRKIQIGLLKAFPNWEKDLTGWERSLLNR